jgi:DNA-binding transcriptional LysR family regulator
MSDIDHLELDGRLLRVFLSVYQTGSVTQAARKLSVSQSSVSHALIRLRRISGDPLFVRSGRGITPTARADDLAHRARALLDDMREFATPNAYDPAADTQPFTIAANDYEVETILRSLLFRLRQFAPEVALRIAPAVTQSNIPQLLRRGDVDLTLGPALAGDESDLLQQVLFTDSDFCFYDAEIRTAPALLADYCGAPHAIVVLDSLRRTEVDDEVEKLGHTRSIMLEAPNFAALPSMMRGTDLIATMPLRLKDSLFRGFEYVRPPVELKAFSIVQIWHSRNSKSPRHRWFREQIKRRCGEDDGVN